MIGLIAKLLLARDPALPLAHARRLATVVLVLGLVFAVCSVAGIWLTLHDRKVIARAETKRQRGEAKTALDAGTRADTAGHTRDGARTAAAAETSTRLETIHAADPKAAHAPASRGTRAVADRLQP